MKDSNTMKFEDKIKEIEKTVRELDSEISLDDAVVKYEAGMRYVEECEKELKRAEVRIHKLVQKKDNSVVIEPIEENEYPTLF
ncbi:MAG: exodeoxyribonuclease VII small subunit [Candidatus Riflemargulisbacteria bacterium]